jgi:solute carrier family 9B (sodium/hydrogen exchanger), member 1/2
VVAVLGYLLFNMPFGISYTLGYTLSCISPSIIVPCIVGLIDRGYGKEKGIPTAIIAAATFDDILTIVNNGICASIAFTKIDDITGEEKESILEDILHIFW